jgi:hypothetical protein
MSEYSCFFLVFSWNLKFLLDVTGCRTTQDYVISAVDRGFEPRSGQTKDYKIGIFCFSAKHAALMRKSKDWLARNRDNVSQWGDMFVRKQVHQYQQNKQSPL